MKTEKQEAPVPAPVISPCSFLFEKGLQSCLICQKVGCCICCRKSSDIAPAESDDKKARKQLEKQKTGLDAGFAPDCGVFYDCHSKRIKFKPGYPVYLNGQPCSVWISAVIGTEIGRRFGQADFWCDGR